MCIAETSIRRARWAGLRRPRSHRRPQGHAAAAAGRPGARNIV